MRALFWIHNSIIKLFLQMVENVYLLLDVLSHTY